MRNLTSVGLLIAFFSLFGLPAEGKDKRTTKPNESKTEDPPAAMAENGTEQAEDTEEGETTKRPPTAPLWLGLGAGLPEIVRLETGYWFGKYFGLGAFVSPPIPLTLHVAVPAITLSATSAFVLETAPTSLTVKALYGPQVGFDLLIRPGTDVFYLLLGGEYRRVTGTATGQSPLYLCPASNKSCYAGGRNGASTSKVTLDGKIDVVSESTALRAGLGWFWEFGGDRPSKSRKTPPRPPPYFCNVALGIFKPLQTKRTVSVSAEAETKFSPAVQSAVQKYLDSIMDQFEGEINRELETQLDPYDKSVLPLLTLSIGMKI